MMKESVSGPFEAESIVSTALTKISGDFKKDLEAFIIWCSDRPQYTEYKRITMGMSPEPYMVDYDNKKPSVEEMLLRAESDLGNAWQSWQWLYSLLDDIKSKLLLINVLAYRTIGWKYVVLPLDSENFWHAMEKLWDYENSEAQENKIDTGFHDLTLSSFDLANIGYPIRLFSDSFGIFNEFIYSQYSFRGRGPSGPNEGDCVIDCGACFGGTSLYFGHKVGKSGRVLSFEFMPDNLKVFNGNLEKNTDIKKRIELIRAPVYSRSGLVMAIQGSGPATQVHPIGEGVRAYANIARHWLISKARKNTLQYVKSTTIDNEVEKRDINKVGLIKMDIEGSEYAALNGARRTIERFKPILAICVYHRLIDFYEVPQFIDGLGLGYKFYLQHSTVHGDETVIFAIPPQRSTNQ